MHKADLIWAIRYHADWSAAYGYRARARLEDGALNDAWALGQARINQALSADHYRIAMDMRLQLLEAAHG